MTVVDGRWPFVGREAEVTGIMRVLGDESVRGVVLVGPSGVGKTMIAQQVLGLMSHHFDHIYLRGSSAHSAIPYGTLNVLLAELDEGTAANPLLVLGALQRRFGVQAKRPTLVHVDGVQDIDEQSATVIAHLARVGAVRLLVTCEDLLDAPGEFFDLWKDRVLERFDIDLLSPDAATQMLATALGAPVSRSASEELWTASAGNPRYLQLAAKADVASGHLFLLDGVWVSQDTERQGSGRTITDWTAGRLAALDAQDRAVVEVLAVADRLPVAILLAALPSPSLDRLQHQGILILDLEGIPTIRFAHEVLSDVVRGQLLSGAGRTALETVSGLRNDPAVPVRSRTKLALWALHQGVTLDVEELTLLARLANDHHIEGAAERFLRAMPAASGGSAVAIERARQLWSDGRLGDGLEAVEAVLESPSESASLEEWVDARLLAARLRLRTHGREQDATALLDDVTARLASEPSSRSVSDLLDTTSLARLDCHLFEGEVALLSEQAVALLAEREDDGRGSARIRNLLSTAQAGMGFQERGLAVARSGVARLSTPTTGGPEQEAAAAQLFGLLMLAGHWKEALTLAERRSSQADVPALGGSSSEFAEGLLLAFLGRSRRALGKLLPAISQFRIRDRYGVLPLAEAAAAYSHVLENETDLAEDHLRAIDLTQQRYPWHLLEAVQYFTLLTDAWLDPPEDVADEFARRAGSLGDRGYHGVGLFFLAQAVQLGRHDSAETLAASAAVTEGPFARLAEAFAKAVTSKDPGALKDVAREALENGNYNLAGDVAAVSVENLMPTHDPMIRVHAEQILRRTSTPARRHVRRKLLSERERAIARLVAQGVANKDIAHQEHISPRTVEGHVHQVMTKLGLSSRKQLSQIFGQQQ